MNYQQDTSASTKHFWLIVNVTLRFIKHKRPITYITHNSFYSGSIDAH